jgi:hypothetical protein
VNDKLQEIREMLNAKDKYGKCFLERKNMGNDKWEEKKCG